MAGTTDNFNLDLYDTGDPAALTDQYNSAMHTIDDTLLTINGNANTALTNINEVKGWLGNLGVTDGTTATSNKTKWDGAASLAATNEADITAIDANLNALGANTVNDATNLKNTINNKQNSYYNSDMVFIGDSITQGYGATDAGRDRWPTLICNYFNATQHNYAVGGAGFTVNGQSSNGRFDIQATTAANDNKYDHNNVRLVFISGGVNDNLTDENSTANTNATLCVNTLRTAFPNATIIAIIGPSGSLEKGKHSLGNIGINQRIKYYRSLIRLLQKLNCATIDGWRLISTNINMQYTDRTHPNTAGYAYMAGQILNSILGGTISYSDSGWIWDLTSYADGSSYLYVQINSESISFNGRLNYTFKEGDPGYGTQTATIDLITLPTFMRFTRASYLMECVFTASYFYTPIGYATFYYDKDNNIGKIQATCKFTNNISTSTSIQVMINTTLPLYGTV